MTMKQTTENTAMIDRDYFDLYSMCDDIIRDANELYESIVRLFEFTEEKSLRHCFSKPELKKLNRVLSKVCRRTDDYARDMCVCVSGDNSSCCCDDFDTCCCDDGDCTNDPTLSPDDLLRDSCDCCPDLDERVSDESNNEDDDDDVEIQVLPGNIVECKTVRVDYTDEPETVDTDSDNHDDDDGCISEDDFKSIGFHDMTYSEFLALTPEKRIEAICEHVNGVLGGLVRDCADIAERQKAAKKSDKQRARIGRKVSRAKFKARHK